MKPFGNSGDQEYFTSKGPMIDSIPYPTAYPEYFGFETQFVLSKRLSPILAKYYLFYSNSS